MEEVLEIDSIVRVSLAAVDAFRAAATATAPTSATTVPFPQLTLHYVGAEEMEVGHDLTRDAVVARYAGLLDGVAASGCTAVHLRFFGPNLLSAARADAPHALEFVHSSMAGGPELRVHVDRHCCLYHEYWATTLLTAGADTMAPDVVIMLNAGVWGYQSWLPTLDTFAQVSRAQPSSGSSSTSSSSSGTHSSAGTLVVATAYTLEEAEDDEDTIRGHYGRPGSGVTAVWLWEAEVNPHRSTHLLERASNVPGRRYYSNHAWQGFQFATTDSSAGVS
jgi:hypothetical protein